MCFVPPNETIRHRLTEILNMASESEHFGLVDYIVDNFFDIENDCVEMQIDELCRRYFVDIQNGWFDFSKLWNDSCVGEIAKDNKDNSLFSYGVEVGALLMCRYLIESK